MDGDVQTVAAPARATSRAENFKMQLDKLGTQFQAVLPPHITVDRFKRVVLTAVSTNPELLDCDQRSLWNACMKAATDGNEPDGRYAALVIFKTKDGKMAQYMPMVMGVLRRARNSGEIAYINAHVVYEGDTFEHYIDDKGEHFKHTPNWRGDRGEPFAVYAVARDKDGNSYVEPMSKAQVERVRQTSRAKDNGPWVTFWDEMARKTALRRLCKKLPASGEVVEVLDRDDWLYETPKQLAPPVVEATAEKPAPETPKPRRARRKLDEFAGQGDDAPPADLPGDEQHGGPAREGAPTAEEPAPTGTEAESKPAPSAPAAAPAPNAAKAETKPAADKIPVAQRRFAHKTGDSFDAFDKSMREAIKDAASEAEITKAWLNHRPVLEDYERKAGEAFQALLDTRDAKLDELRG